MRSNPFFTIFFLFFILLGFQNCGYEWNIKNTIGNAVSSEGGSGVAYDGKLYGEFYHFIPDYQCENQTNAESYLTFTASLINYTENKNLKCGFATSVLDTQDVDSSIHQGYVIGYKEKIFEKRPEAPILIPNNLVEAWCQESSDRGHFEVIAYYDRIVKKAHLRQFLRNNDGTTTIIPEQEVARFVASTVVEYDTIDYKLAIDKAQLSTRVGVYKGLFNANSTSIGIPLDCRLGGVLDAKLWPSALVDDGNIGFYKYLPKAQKIVFQTDPWMDTSYLVSLDLNTLKKEPLSGAKVRGEQLYPIDFIVSEEQEIIFFRGEDILEHKNQRLFKARLDGSEVTAISPIGVHKSARNSQNTLSLEMLFGQLHVFYSSELFVNGFNIESLVAWPLNGGTPFKLYAAQELPVDPTITQGGVGKITWDFGGPQLIASAAIPGGENFFIVFDILAELDTLYTVYSPATKTYRILTSNKQLKMGEPAPYRTGGPQLLLFSKTGEWVFIPLQTWTYTRLGAPPKSTLAINLMSGSIHVIDDFMADNNFASEQLPDGARRLLSDYIIGERTSPNKAQFITGRGTSEISTNNNILIKVGSWERQNFDSSTLAYWPKQNSILINNSGELRILKGAIPDQIICGQAFSKILSVLESPVGVLYFARAGLNTAITEFGYQTIGGDCIVENSLPSSVGVNIEILEISDQGDILAKVKRATLPGQVQNEIYLIPFGGRPPIRISSPIGPSQTKNVHFIFKGKSVLIYSDDITARGFPGDLHIWNLPQ